MITRGERTVSLIIGVLIILVAIAGSVAIFTLDQKKTFIFKPYIHPKPTNSKLILQEK